MKDELGESIFGVSETPPRRAGRRGPTGGAALRTRDDEVAEASRAAAQLERRRRRTVRRRRGIRWLVLVAALCLVAAAGWRAVQFLRPMVSGFGVSDDFAGNGTGTAVVVVHSGDSGRAIGATLEKAGVVKTAKAFADAASNDPKGDQIQPGSYRLRKQMSAAAALAMLLDPSRRSVPRVTVREGLWRNEVVALLAKSTGRPVADYQKALARPDLLGLPPAAHGNVEGYLFPATYEFGKDATATAQLTTMVEKSVAELKSLGVSAASMERTVTLASIVQAEARRPVDFPKVARVVDNRLEKGMLLQLDSTVSYGAGRRSITTTPAERAKATPFNTYRRPGLPAGPIGNPGLQALQSALHPATGPWLYFVAVNPLTGETRYAVDAAGHAANQALFQKWCSAHPGKC